MSDPASIDPLLYEYENVEHDKVAQQVRYGGEWALLFDDKLMDDAALQWYRTDKSLRPCGMVRLDLRTIR